MIDYKMVASSEGPERAGTGRSCHGTRWGRSDIVLSFPSVHMAGRAEHVQATVGLGRRGPGVVMCEVYLLEKFPRCQFSSCVVVVVNDVPSRAHSRAVRFLPCTLAPSAYKLRAPSKSSLFRAVSLLSWRHEIQRRFLAVEEWCQALPWPSGRPGHPRWRWVQLSGFHQAHPSSRRHSCRCEMPSTSSTELTKCASTPLRPGTQYSGALPNGRGHWREDRALQDHRANA